MKAIAEQLDNLVFLETYLADCPINCRSRVIEAEINQIKPNPPISENSIIKQRWIKFKTKIDPSKVGNINADILFETMAAKCRQLIIPFTDQEEVRSLDIKKYNNLLEKQQNLFLNECLINATEITLKNYQNKLQNHSSCALLPKAPDILTLALSMYKKDLYRETIYQYETDTLVARHTTLTSIKKTLGREHVLQKILDPIDNELRAINNKLGIQDSRNRDLTSFKLSGTALIVEHLGELNDLTETNLNSQIDIILKEIGTNPIDQELNINPNGNTINNYLTPRDGTSLSNQLLHTIKNIENIVNTIKLPTTAERKEVVTDTDEIILQNLRGITKQYTLHLADIEINEKQLYLNRNQMALQNRKNAVKTLERCLNHTARLTQDIKDATKALITEINLQQPHWSELSFINKLMDFLTFGIRALIRHSTFKQSEIHQNLEKSFNDTAPETILTAG